MDIWKDLSLHFVSLTSCLLAQQTWNRRAKRFRWVFLPLSWKKPNVALSKTHFVSITAFVGHEVMIMYFSSPVEIVSMKITFSNLDKFSVIRCLGLEQKWVKWLMLQGLLFIRFLDWVCQSFVLAKILVPDKCIHTIRNSKRCYPTAKIYTSQVEFVHSPSIAFHRVGKV